MSSRLSRFSRPCALIILTAGAASVLALTGIAPSCAAYSRRIVASPLELTELIAAAMAAALLLRADKISGELDVLSR